MEWRREQFAPLTRRTRAAAEIARCTAAHLTSAPHHLSAHGPPQELIDKLMEGDKEKYTAGASGADR